MKAPIDFLRGSVFSILLLAILVIGCAKSVAPPGGPPDRTPPQYLSATPQPGAVLVSADTDVTFCFDEAVDPKTAVNAVFITPQPDPPAKIKVHNDRIVITFPGGLKPERTYVITVGTDLKDAHGVNLKQAIPLSFSTGTSIDSGSVAGAVYKDDSAAANISLVLFEASPDEYPGAIDSLAPLYLTQSGQDGTYCFDYLPPGRYWLVAFEDRNKNRRINSAAEMIGLPFREINLAPEERKLSEVGLRLVLLDTGRVNIQSVTVNPDRLIKIKFDRRLGHSQADKLFASVSIRESADSTRAATVSGYVGLSPFPTNEFALLAGELSPPAEYQLRIDLKGFYPELADSLRLIVYPFKGQEIVDGQAPEMIESAPRLNQENVPIDIPIQLIFSEPLQGEAVPFLLRLASDLPDTIELEVARIDPFHFGAKPTEPLRSSGSYSLLIDEAMVKDRAGNPMGDSLTIIPFTTIGRDTLGILSGTVEFSRPGEAAFPTMIRFKPTEGAGGQDFYLPPGQMEFRQPLLPGYYTISAFVDGDNDSLYDYGSIKPYRLSEPFTVVADTFRVRTRSETTGAKIRF